MMKKKYVQKAFVDEGDKDGNGKHKNKKDDMVRKTGLQYDTRRGGRSEKIQ